MREGSGSVRQAHLDMEVLRSESPDNIRKQILALCIIYNLVRLVMLKAAKQQYVPPDRISFTGALRWLITADQGSRRKEDNLRFTNPIYPCAPVKTLRR